MYYQLSPNCIQRIIMVNYLHKKNLIKLTGSIFGVSALAFSLNAQPVFDFPFDEGEGETTTDLVNSFVGTLGIPVTEADYPVVDTTTSPSGLASDQSLRVNRPNAYLITGEDDTSALADVSQPLTAEAWIFVPADSVPQAEGIVGYGGSWKLALGPDGSLVFTLFGVVDVASGQFPALGGWSHIAAVFEPGVGVEFFIDGFSVGFVEETRPMRDPIYNQLGIGSAGRGEAFNGWIDRVRVTQALLTVDQLDSDAANPKAPLPETIVSYDFSESEAPFASAGTEPAPATPAIEVFSAENAPEFAADSPTGLEGDSSVFFDGNDRIIVPDPNGLFQLGDPNDPEAPTNFTVQAWVKFSDQPGGRSVLFFSNLPGGAISFSVTQDRRVFVTTLGIADMTSDAFIPLDEGWHHIAVVLEAGVEVRYYVDGILGFTRPYTGNVVKTRTDTQFYIGSEPTGGLPFTGYIDRLKLTNGVVPASELDFRVIPGVDPDAPEIMIGTAVSVSWSSEARGFILQQTADMEDPESWMDVNAQPTLIDDMNFIFQPATGEEVFYRLIRPDSE